MSEHIRIRAAARDDVPLVFALINELAEYERAPDQVTGSEELLERALFGPDAVAEAVIAEAGAGPGDGTPGAARGPAHGEAPEPAGFALFYRTFSTWQCLPGMWLEDLYVSPRHRRSGIGRVLLAHLAQIAIERGYGRIEWTALDWNTPALRFYDTIGASMLHEWEAFRLDGSALRTLAGA